jgi:hypothetical protein
MIHVQPNYVEQLKHTVVKEKLINIIKHFGNYGIKFGSYKYFKVGTIEFKLNEIHGVMLHSFIIVMG